MQKDSANLQRGPSGLLCAFISLAFLALVVGCGKGDQREVARVHGKVTYKGQPVPEASLVFVPTGGGPSAQANADASGSYVLGTYGPQDGAVVGEHKVMITAMKNAGGSGLPEDSKGGGNTGAVSIIPMRYGNLEKSGLKATVRSGKDNEVNFELTD